MPLASAGDDHAPASFSIGRDQQVQLHPVLPRPLARQLRHAGRPIFLVEVRTSNAGRDRIERRAVTLRFVRR